MIRAYKPRQYNSLWFSGSHSSVSSIIISEIASLTEGYHNHFFFWFTLKHIANFDNKHHTQSIYMYASSRGDERCRQWKNDDEIGL